jgi:hypothetical protein
MRIAGVLVGVFYGLCARLAFSLHDTGGWFAVMSWTFIAGVPTVLGFLTVYLAEREGPLRWVERVFLPWLTMLLALAGAFALAWEGLICIIMMLPAALVLATMGGLLAVGARRLARPTPGAHASILLCSLLLPFAAAPIEHRLPASPELRRVRTSIEIAADPATVWRNIERVPRITAAEQRPTLFHAIGFPRPVEATLSRPGLGGVRHATFEGGVLFVETIDVWQPGRRLAFSIHADPRTIPPSTLDEHVTVGGPIFDVLRGEYEIEQLGPRQVVLHLQSTHRLATHFNVYSGLWTNFILKDVQESILEILRRRCERG